MSCNAMCYMEMTHHTIVLPAFIMVIQEGLILEGKHLECRKVSSDPGSKSTHDGFSNVVPCIRFAIKMEQGTTLCSCSLSF
jgi:hypothetical protein